MVTPEMDSTDSTKCDGEVGPEGTVEDAPVPEEEGAEAAADGNEETDAVAEPEQPAAEAEVVELDPMAVLRGELTESANRLRAVSKAYTDLQRDMDSFRKRVEEQGKVKRELKAFETVKTFFEPVENLRRSLLNHGEDMAMLVEGLRLILAQFDSGLAELGLTEVPGEGAVFNPAYHEALAMSPVPEAELDGRVIMVHNAGYMVNGKVLQAAQVIVGQYSAPEPAEA